MPQARSDQPTPWGFSPSQRLVLIVLALGLLIAAIILAISHRAYIPAPYTQEGSRANFLLVGIDPNTATVYELMMLPQIGLGRAREIVAYRQRVLQSNPSSPAFMSAQDLLQVRGIGRALMNQMRPHLRFPVAPDMSVVPPVPATAPAAPIFAPDSTPASAPAP